MYHIITNIELLFDGLAQAEAWAKTRSVIYPSVPKTAMDEEDRTTPRICVAPSIEDCFTAIGVTGQFRRCCAMNDGAKSYENSSEAYPVLVLKFPDGLAYVKPDRSQVPDIAATREQWLLEAAIPKTVMLKWLDACSVLYDDSIEDIRTICTSVRFIDKKDLRNYSHPWLDGKGHPLDSSDMGGEPWPDIARALSQLYLDMSDGGHVGFQTPLWPPDGRVRFSPVQRHTEAWNTFPHRLKQFTCMWDRNGRPMFEDDHVAIAYDGRRCTGILTRRDGYWTILGPESPDMITPEMDVTVLSGCPAHIQEQLAPYRTGSVKTPE